MPENDTIPTLAERLQRIWQIARRRWVLIASITAAATVAAVLMASRATPQYGATARVVLANTELVGVPATTPVVQNADPQADLNTKVGLIVSPPVANTVNSDLHLRLPLETLLLKVTATLEGTSNIVDITATDPDPARAQAIANTFASDYVAYRNSLARSALQSASASLHREIAALGSSPANAAQASALQGQLRQVSLDSVTQTGGALIVAQASSAKPTTSHPMLTAGLAGILVGLLLALTIVLILEMTDRRLKDLDEVADAGFGVRVLTGIPRARGTQKPSLLVDSNKAQAEAYENVARQLLLAARRRAMSTVLVTSPGSGDGKTAVTLGVARALARLHRSVLVIETDDRASLLPDDLMRQGRMGLAGVAAGTATLQSEIVHFGVSTDGTDQPATGISVLPRGRGGEGQHLLAQPAIATLIAESRQLADFVLVDGPATPGFPDALALVDGVEAALVVARLRATAKDALHESLETLQTLSMRVLGLVLTDAEGRGTPPRRVGNGAVVPLADNLGDRRTPVLPNGSFGRRFVSTPNNDQV